MSDHETTTMDPEQTQDDTAEQQQCCGQIRESAYYKWEAAGCPCGDGVEFWLQAETEITDEGESESESNGQ